MNQYLGKFMATMVRDIKEQARKNADREARKIIAQETTLWDFCNGCKIGCPYEVSAFTNSPMLALESGLNFLRII